MKEPSIKQSNVPDLLFAERNISSFKQSSAPIGLERNGLTIDPRIERIIREIETNYHREISFPLVAVSLNLSLSRLRHLFKYETGESLKSYLPRTRLNKSKQLLETNFLSVKQIALKVSIRDYSHFIKDFEKTFGLSPRRYRKNRSGEAAKY